jgi:hypothetical protein
MNCGNAPSMEAIDIDDLRRLAALAEADERALIGGALASADRYQRRLMCRALCQGAALHFVDGVNGVKDFDVWSFYAALPTGPFPYRATRRRDRVVRASLNRRSRARRTWRVGAQIDLSGTMRT